MRGIYLVLSVALGAVLGIAESNQHPNFSGTWISGDTRLEIRQDLTSIEITEKSGKNRDASATFTCSTMGKECPMSDGGQKASVRVWYNGPKLVVFKTDGRKGDVVGKRRLSIAPAGDTIEMEIIHIVPAGDTQKMVLRRSQ